MVYLASIGHRKEKLSPKRLQRSSVQLDLPPVIWPHSPATTPPSSCGTSPSSRASSSRASVSPKVTPRNIDSLRLKVLQASFVLADKDRDNQLSKAEFSLMLRRANPGANQSVIDKAFLMASLGCGPVISFDAFVEWARKDYKEEADDDIEPLWSVYRLWDMDEDGAISPPELEYSMKKAFPKIKREELLLLLSAMDEDGNGEVGYLEFVNFIFPPEQAAPSAQVSARVMGG